MTIGSELFGKQVGYWMERAAGGEEITVTFRGRPRVRLVPSGPPPHQLVWGESPAGLIEEVAD